MTSLTVLARSASPRLRPLTLNEAVHLLPFAGGAAAAAAIALVAFKVWRVPHFAHFSAVARWAIMTLAASLILSVLLRRLLASWPSWISRDGAAAWLLAIELGVVLLVVPVFLLAKGVPEDEMIGWTWPLVNKRWLLALYNLSIATFLVFPIAIDRWRSGAYPDSEDSNRPPDRPNPRTHWTLAVLGQAVVVALCWYLAGPPWHLERHHRVIDWHEQLHLGPLQAVHKGYLPAVGPAATPYGPGSQVLTYELMKLAGSFDLVSFRISWATQQFIAVLAVGIAAYWWLGAVPAVAVILLAFTFSSLAFYSTHVDGTMGGFFGWANALRYITPLIVVPTLATTAIREVLGWKIVLLGVAWGLGSLLAQEGLTTTATAGVMVLTLLCLTRTIPLSRAVWLFGKLTLGFACAVTPVLVYYALHHAAGTFVRSYFFFARAVAVGYSNIWWPAQDAGRPDRYSYYFTLPFILGCGIGALWRFPGLRVVAPLDCRRTRFLALICVQLVCFQTVLLRSDAAHLMNTMLALPFVIVMGFIELPRWLATTQVKRWAIRAAFAAIVLAVYPTFWTAANLERWQRPARRFEARSFIPAPVVNEDRVAYRRTTPQLVNEPFLVENSVSVAEFLDFVTEVHDIVGQRKTFFLQIGWTTGGGLIAFMADLMPAPHPLGGELLSVNDNVKAEVAQHIRAHPKDYEAFIGPSLIGPEAQAFLDSHPGAVTLERWLGESAVYILLSKM